MLDFVVGGTLVALDGRKIDTLRSKPIFESQDLVPGIDTLTVCDPTLATIELRVPAGVDNADVHFFVKRVANGPFFVQLINDEPGDTIDGGTEGSILGNQNEWIHISSYGTTNWIVMDRRTFSIAAMQRNNDTTTVGLTTEFVKVDLWDFNAYSTPGRILADEANNKLSVINLQNPIRDGYRLNMNADMRFTNNVDVELALFVDGAQTSIGDVFTGKSNTDLPVSLEGVFSLLQSGGVPQDLDIRVKADSPADLTVRAGAGFIVDRLGG